MRFRSGGPAYLRRTLTTPTDQKEWTFSVWFKRGNATTGSFLSSSSDATIGYNSDALDIYYWTGSSAWRLITTQVLRDPTAWYHLVVAYDSTQATAADRIKVHINGRQVTAFSTASYPSLNATSSMNAAAAHRIGYRIDNVWALDGYVVTSSASPWLRTRRLATV